jgi:hypothetical protein
MGLGEKYQANLEKAAAPLIDGPLVAATAASPAGAMSKLIASEIFNVGTAAMGGTVIGTRATGSIETEGTKRVSLPLNFAVVVTPSSVYFFKWKLFWGRVKIKKELARFPREGLEVSVQPGKMATQFGLLSATQRTWTAFEMGTLGMATAKAKVEEMTKVLTQSDS